MNTLQDARQLLKDNFGFDDFLSGQADVISHLIAGESAAAVFPTGGGKSLCYQLPALMFPGLTLVVSPLIALMKDQIDALTARGISAARLDSTLDTADYLAVMDAMRSRTLRLLYVAPERFNNERFRQNMLQQQISLFAVDEAHCISEWGHNFRPDYLKLAGFAKQCEAERVLALTATATESVLDDICRGFSISNECAVRTGFYRPNLTLLSKVVKASDRDQILVDRIRSRPTGPTIVYVTLQKTAEQTAKLLAQSGYQARAYHAGLADELRTEVQEWFMASDQAIVAATIAFGMGIDKSNIRYVYHYNLPKSLENYSQEIGRSGRDGQPSTCEILYCPDDLNSLENFVFGDTPSRDAVASLASELLESPNLSDVSFYELSRRHNIRPLVVRTLMTYLELDDYIESGTPFYSEYSFKPLVPSVEILNQFEGERRDFLADVFRQARKSKVWFHIDLDQTARKLKQPRDRIVRALDYCGDKNYLELKVAKARHRFQRKRVPDNISELVDDLHGRMLTRERNEIQRLGQVVSLVSLDACQVSALCAHFGEQLERDCGHCFWCINKKPLDLPERSRPSIDDAQWSKAATFRTTRLDILADPRNLARFLCGLSSPALVKAKLTKDSLFGLLTAVPFMTVLERATADRSSGTTTE